MTRPATITRLLALLLLLGALTPAAALAHGGSTGAAQTYVQALGAYEARLTIRPTGPVPGPLLVEVSLGGAGAGGLLLLRAAPAGEWPSSANQAQVRPLAGQPGPYYAQLQVDRAGPWDLDVQLEGAGGGRASIPFTVATPAPAPGELALSGAFGGLAVCLVAGGALGALGRRRQVAAWLVWPIAAGAVASLSVALTLAAQQSLARPAPPPAARPHINLALRSAPAAPQAGQPMALELALSDGATGQPADDLAPHHDALLHLVVISADGGFFAHLHPARVAPGIYRVGLTPDRPGQYTAYAELERRDSGAQLVARSFGVAGPAAAAASDPPGLGPRQLGGLGVDVQSTRAPLRAGEPTTLSLSVSADGAPVAAIEPWLGMAGHLIVRSDDGAIVAHVHAAGAMGAARYGPQIQFAYSFPQPGAYRLWAQFQYRGQVVTVPIRLAVQP